MISLIRRALSLDKPRDKLVEDHILYKNVYLGKLNDKKVIIKKKHSGSNNKHEAEILRLMSQSPYAVKLIKETSDSNIIEYCSGGDLYDYLMQHRNMSLDEICQVGKFLCKAIIDMRNRNVLHLDIKTENICLKGGLDNLALIDFEKAELMDTIIEKDIIMSGGYISPEVASLYLDWITNHHNKRFSRYISSKKISCSYLKYADIWSIGVVFYVLAYGRLPFHFNVQDLRKSFTEVINLQYEIPDCRFPEMFNLLIRKILVRRGEDRPEPEEIILMLDSFTCSQENSV